MEILDTETFSVCPDCVMALHYGWEDTAEQLHGAYDSEPGGAELVERWVKGFRNWQQHSEWTEFELPESDPHFSWSRCETCDGIGGDRYDITAYIIGVKP